MAITGCRNDALVKVLNNIGYQPILLPRTGLTPPDVYIYKNLTLARRGPLLDYLPDGTTLPTPLSSQIPSIENHETDKKSGSAAGSFLGTALKCIGITSAPKLDISFASGHDLTFSFENVTSESIDPSKIDRLLTKLDTGAIPKEDIAAGYLHIAYDYAYAGSLSMSAATSASSSFNAKALQIGAYIDLGTQGQVTVQSETTLSFSGNNVTRAAFACKIGRLQKRGSKWTFSITEDPGESFLTDERTPDPYLLERGVVLSVEDPASPA